MVINFGGAPDNTVMTMLLPCSDCWGEVSRSFHMNARALFCNGSHYSNLPPSRELQPEGSAYQSLRQQTT
eukprot:1501236-Amphidinium_carterae.1